MTKARFKTYGKLGEMRVSRQKNPKEQTKEKKSA